MIISCNKSFVSTEANTYTVEDIANFEHCITEGIRSIKNWVIDSEGAYTLAETKDKLVITASEDSFSSCFENVEDGKSEFKGFIKGIMGTLDNYAISHEVQ